MLKCVFSADLLVVDVFFSCETSAVVCSSDVTGGGARIVKIEFNRRKKGDIILMRNAAQKSWSKDWSQKVPECSAGVRLVSDGLKNI